MALCSVALCHSSSAASFIFDGGNLEAAANWTNQTAGGTGLPGDGDTGTIAVDGTVTGNNQVGGFGGATLTQTAGTITATPGFNFFNSGGSTIPTYNLQGGTLNLGTGLLNANGSTVNLTGGELFYGGRFISNNATGVLNIGGSVVITASGAVDIDISTATGVFDFATDWTGSFSSGVTTTEADWIQELVTNTGDGTATVGGTAITAGNFTDYFEVTPISGGGSTLTLVPEPSSVALLGLGGLALIMRRRK